MGKEPARYKARLIAKGFAQREGIDFNEIFSPIVKHTSVRMLLSLVCGFDSELEQMDVKTSFLHGDLEETILMKQPEGFEVQGIQNQVCKLNKSLYELKQSPRQWYRKFDNFMLVNGYTSSIYDSCVYLKRFNVGEMIYLLLCVDDMLIACRDNNEIKKLKV